MQTFAPWLLALAAAGIAVAAALWWRHRRKMAEMERRLAWSEASRFELEHQVQAADEKLQALAHAVRKQHSELQSARELSERRTALDRVLADAPESAQPPVTEWPDTLPLGPAGFRYAETMPAELTPAEKPGHRR